ncbi:COX15/CtaA family protein [Pseudopedobacter beijingensis]|uniref:Heme A synthase n=1 Tax=Pseudopedobacter beijingensis TaxID=1207056 RepID=A0ABW4I934_9SPHI
MHQKKEKRFIRYNLYTIVLLFLVILAGGVVRSSGSGMGCPDWPKCFDHYIPPTDISQLPADYQEKYVAKRIEKNERFANMLDKMGYNELADKVRHDETIKVPEEFNVAKTYTEYVNRLVGATTGIFLLLSFFFSFVYIKRATRIFVLSLLNLFLIVFQAWLGSIVVSTNLLAWTITVHMIAAILILAIAIYTYHYARSLEDRSVLSANSQTLIKLLLYSALLISFAQIVIGTEVRETVDAIVQLNPHLGRSEWLNGAGEIYHVHKLLAIVVVVSALIIYILIKKRNVGENQLKFAKYCLLLVGFQYFLGVVLNQFAMPPAAQALHMLFATIMFGAQFYLLLMLNTRASLN